MIFATNGAKFYIGAALARKYTDFIASDFTSQTWVEIAEIESLGSLGDTSQEIPWDPIGTARTARLKGGRSAGTMEIVCGIDYADPGQLALLEAEKESDDFAFRVVFNDAPAGGTPSERLFIAAVGSAVEVLDTKNSVMKLNASLWVNSNVVRVSAAAGA